VPFCIVTGQHLVQNVHTAGKTGVVECQDGGLVAAA